MSAGCFLACNLERFFYSLVLGKRSELEPACAICGDDVFISLIIVVVPVFLVLLKLSMCCCIVGIVVVYEVERRVYDDDAMFFPKNIPIDLLHPLFLSVFFSFPSFPFPLF